MQNLNKYLIDVANGWKNFPLNHAKLNGSLLENYDLIKPHLGGLSKNGLYCYSCKKDGIEICLRIGISEKKILSRLKSHYKNSKRKDVEKQYDRFFGILLGDSDLTVWYKPAMDEGLPLKDIEKMLMVYYLPVWEFPFETIKPEINTTEALLEFGKKLQEKAHHKVPAI